MSRPDSLPEEPPASRSELLIILGMVLACNIRYLSPRSIPVHDTMQVFNGFYFFYNNFFWRHTLPLWLPYGNFGWTTMLTQPCISPGGYLLGLLGALARIKDALLIFKLSILADQCFSAIGLWRLSTLLFSRKDTRLLVGLATAGCVVWYAQIYFNFRIYYLFPLGTYFLFSFFKSQRLGYLALSGITMMTQCVVGGANYFLCLWFFVFTIMTTSLLIAKGMPWRSFTRIRKTDAALMALWVLTACFFIYYIQYSMDLTRTLVSGRDPITGKTTLQSFLTWGTIDYKSMLPSLVFAWPTHLGSGSPRDNSVYVGLLCLPFFAWALIRVRDHKFFSLLSGFIALVWLARGGTFAKLVYHFPLMAYYRHIGLVHSSAKILLILCAGFGWEDFWENASPHITPKAAQNWAWFSLILACLSSELLWLAPYSYREWQIFVLRLEIYNLALAAACLWQVGSIARNVRWTLLAIMAADLLFYQAVVYRESRLLPINPDGITEIFKVHPILYQDKRLRAPDQPLSKKAIEVGKFPPFETFAVYYNFAQFDPCRPLFRVLTLSPWVSLFGGILPGHKDSRVDVITGCGIPKIRFVPKAIYADSDGHAAKILMHTSDPRATVVISGPSFSAAGSSQDVPPKASYRIVSYDPDRLTVAARVESHPGAWLVYADAWHPGWTAHVNGIERPIGRSDLAFKALWLNRGPSFVEFVFRPTKNLWLSRILALFGIAFACVIPLFLSDSVR